MWSGLKGKPPHLRLGLDIPLKYGAIMKWANSPARQTHTHTHCSVDHGWFTLHSNPLSIHSDPGHNHTPHWLKPAGGTLPLQLHQEGWDWEGADWDWEKVLTHIVNCPSTPTPSSNTTLMRKASTVKPGPKRIHQKLFPKLQLSYWHRGTVGCSHPCTDWFKIKPHLTIIIVVIPLFLKMKYSNISFLLN